MGESKYGAGLILRMEAARDASDSQTCEDILVDPLVQRAGWEAGDRDGRE
jgi:hypothetical protein